MRRQDSERWPYRAPVRREDEREYIVHSISKFDLHSGIVRVKKRQLYRTPSTVQRNMKTFCIQTVNKTSSKDHWELEWESTDEVVFLLWQKRSKITPCIQSVKSVFILDHWERNNNAYIAAFLSHTRKTWNKSCINSVEWTFVTSCRERAQRSTTTSILTLHLRLACRFVSNHQKNNPAFSAVYYISSRNQPPIMSTGKEGDKVLRSLNLHKISRFRSIERRRAHSRKARYGSKLTDLIAFSPCPLAHS